MRPEMDKQLPREERSNGPSLQEEIDELRMQRARLRIAYIMLFRQYLELDEFCSAIIHNQPLGEN